MSTQQLYSAPKVGGDALSYCSRCKIDLAHVIVSMVGKKPAKVICKTCKATHNFRLGAPVKRTPGVKRTATERVVVNISEYWEKKMTEKKGVAMKPYSIKGLFTKGDVIDHPNFGVGIIEDVKINGKITVLFKESEKILVHGMK